MSPAAYRLSIAMVALLAEGVDRNTEREDKVAERNLSPSSRRAWIEIENPGNAGQNLPSPSSRRAWIEIFPGIRHDLAGVGRPPRGGRG